MDGGMPGTSMERHLVGFLVQLWRNIWLDALYKHGGTSGGMLGTSIEGHLVGCLVQV